MLGSGVFAGAFDLAPTLAIEDKEGKTLGGELTRIGYAGEAAPGDRKIKAAWFRAFRACAGTTSS
jgi:N-carbamoyl-L-amino-acid hydrolase